MPMMHETCHTDTELVYQQVKAKTVASAKPPKRWAARRVVYFDSADSLVALSRFCGGLREAHYLKAILTTTMTMLKILAMAMGRLGLRPYTRFDGPNDNDDDGNGEYNSDDNGDGSEHDTDVDDDDGQAAHKAIHPDDADVPDKCGDDADT